MEGRGVRLDSPLTQISVKKVITSASKEKVTESFFRMFLKPFKRVLFRNSFKVLSSNSNKKEAETEQKQKQPFYFRIQVAPCCVLILIATGSL